MSTPPVSRFGRLTSLVQNIISRGLQIRLMSIPSPILSNSLAFFLLKSAFKLRDMIGVTV